MSTGMFEGLEGIALAGNASEQYTHGALAYDQDYVDALAGAYAEAAAASRQPHGHIPHIEPEGELASLLRWLPDYITRFTGFGGQAFLDAVSDTLLRRMPQADDDECFHAHVVLSPVMRELCKAGHSSLTLDLSDWPHTPCHLLDGVKASAERPFYAECIIPAHSSMSAYVGEYSEHCVIRVSGTPCQAGTGSSHCDFILDSLPRESFGRSSRASAYRFACASGIDISRARRTIGGGSTHDGEFTEVLGYEPDGYYASVKDIGGQLYLFHLPDEFFWEGNTLLVPDGATGWKEVRP